MVSRDFINFKYLNTDQLKKTKQNPQTIFAASPCLRMYVYFILFLNLFYHLQSRKTEDVRIYHMRGVVRLDAPSGE